MTDTQRAGSAVHNEINRLQQCIN